MTLKAGVIGNPITHSLSPEIFSFLAKRQGIPLEYSRILISHSSELETLLTTFRNDPSWMGLNVTLPWKTKIPPFLDLLSPESREIGSINHLRKVGGNLVGANTDASALLSLFSRYEVSHETGKAMVFGAGGTARAVIYALAVSGFKTVFVRARNNDRLQELRNHFSLSYPQLQILTMEQLLSSQTPISTVINATSLGTDPSYFDPLSKLTFSKNVTLLEVNYRPELTHFLSRTSNKLSTTRIFGLEMLVEQAMGSWSLWFPHNRLPSNTEQELLGYLRSKIYSDRPIVITGFMGTGKTTVGLELARQLDRDFLDSDQEIEKQSSKTISQWFKEGESEFRRFEGFTIEKLLERKNSVLALGGGSLLSLELQSKVLENTVLVALEAPLPSLFSRLKSMPRPILSKNLTLEQLSALYEERKQGYQCAHLAVQTERKTPMQITQNILASLSELCLWKDPIALNKSSQVAEATRYM